MTALGYEGRWNATDQVPRRALEDGRLSRFGAVDPSDGGESWRYSLSLEGQRLGSARLSRVQAWAVASRLDLFSNFTYLLDDPVNGDQFEQADRRNVYGLHASHLWSASRAVEGTVGLQLRHDDVRAVGLHRTRARRRLSTVRSDAVGQTTAGLYAQTDVRWGASVRTVAGARADLYRFDVDSSDPRNSGVATAAILSPKLSLVLGPWRRTEAYVNFGYGFHSNDGRGATIRFDPASGAAVHPVDPLVRAVGTEIGLRTSLDRGHATLAAWMLGLDSELVFVGDAGTTEAGRASRRQGVELAAGFRLQPWLTLEGSLAWSRSRFRDHDPGGDRIPGAAGTVANLDASVRAGRWLGTAGMRYFGGRPLSEDGRVRSRPSALVAAHLGYSLSPRLRVKADVFNLLDVRASDVDYYYRSRLAGEPAEGIEDVHSHPAEPRSVRLGLTARF